MIKGLLIDISGTLIENGIPISGSISWLNNLIDNDLPFLLLTNTTIKTRKELHSEILSLGFIINPDQIINPEVVAFEHIKNKYLDCKIRNLLPRHELNWDVFEKDIVNPDIIILGDLGDKFERSLLDDLMNQMLNGAELVALHKSKYWREDSKLKVDLGGYVALLEYTTGKKAHIIGKPSKTFFQEACRQLGVSAENVLMVGDDIYSDVLAAREAGLQVALVKTGKYLPENAKLAEKENVIKYDSISEIKLF